MNRARSLAIPSAAVALLLLAPSSSAHEREFTLSRDWFLPYKGESEVESRTFWNTRNNSIRQQFEYEYGVTDWFAIEPGIEFHHDDEDSFKAEAIDFELRFHFLTFEYERVLPALNVEYEHALDSDENDHGELKGIVSWYGETGHDLTLNVNVGRELVSGGDHESEATFGYVRPFGELEPGDEAGLHSAPRFGVEAAEDFQEHHVGAGPLVVFRGTEHLNVLTSYIFGMNDRDQNGDELRLILEWEF